MREEILRLENVTRVVDDVVLLDKLNLHIFCGEIMGVVCLNGYGQESLIELISQNLPILYGRIYFHEELVNNYAHSSNTLNKVYVIEDPTKLVKDLSVADNVFVLRRGFRNYVIKSHVLNRQLKMLMDELDIQIDGKTQVEVLSPFEKCVVELLKAVTMGVKLIVVRDICNFISSADLPKFQRLIRMYAAQGVSFLYVCNHHEEAFKICDRISLMENGKILRVLERANFRRELIKPYYVNAFHREEIPHKEGNGVLGFHDVVTNNMNGLSFRIEKGECVILLDINHTVADDIVRVMNGEMDVISGEIRLEEKPYRLKSSGEALRAGIAFIGQYPVPGMLFEDMSYIENLCFLLSEKSKRIWFDRRVLKSVIREYEPLIGPDIHAKNITELSLTSLYNLVYYRVHVYHPKILFCVQPFADADMPLRSQIILLIQQLKKKGIAVVILATSFSDSLMVADRMLQVENGKLSQEFDRSQFHHFSQDATVI
ncbi:ATP-binding cassette domain-containing protein [Diplocloster hominis]|uniref:ATP-binding cassette domain-containing protein n=1 Tax=Diplocloster hominis TaxID=3079010 RepID=UPI0031BA356B